VQQRRVEVRPAWGTGYIRKVLVCVLWLITFLSLRLLLSLLLIVSSLSLPLPLPPALDSTGSAVTVCPETLRALLFPPPRRPSGRVLCLCVTARLSCKHVGSCWSSLFSKSVHRRARVAGTRTRVAGTRRNKDGTRLWGTRTGKHRLLLEFSFL
jgi:hypothetical protein